MVYGLWLALVCLALPCAGQDLGVVADGKHLWLVFESAGESGEQIEVYHRVRGDEPGRMRVVEPIAGRLRPGGVAAGGGRLLLVMDDGRVMTRTPFEQAHGWGWAFRSGELPTLPDGCSLASFVAGDESVWALVRVDKTEALSAIEPRPVTARRLQQDEFRRRLNLVLGLPPEVDLFPDRSEPAPEPEAESDEPGSDAQNGTETETENEADAPADDDAAGEPGPDAAPDASTDQDAPGDTDSDAGAEIDAEVQIDVPVYRLLQMESGGWVSVPLPEGFGLPRRAALVERDAGRPVIVTQPDNRDWRLVMCLPREGTGWREAVYSLPGSGPWAVTPVAGQVVLAVERERGQDRVWTELYLLRAGRAHGLGAVDLPTTSVARWGVVGTASEAMVLTRPGPLMQSGQEGDEPPVALAGFRRVGLNGVQGEVEALLPREPTRWEKNADWLIQILTFAAAMALMMLFWRQTPGRTEVRLPERIVLAPLSRRMLSGLIDLTPGLWVAGAVYGLGVDELLLRHWPGTPVPKPPAAMIPGWVVIAVTVGHTTACEFIAARSIGKWFTGLYVADFRGVPAPPGATFVRSITKVLDLVAWLLLLLPIISPHRQRLGDVLAKTVVVMREPEEPEERSEDDA